MNANNKIKLHGLFFFCDSSHGGMVVSWLAVVNYVQRTEEWKDDSVVDMDGLQ